MTTVVKASSAAELLALAPRLLGFTPTDSLVLIPMARGRSVGALRVDLPGADAADGVAQTVLGMICRIQEAEALTAVIYADAACGGGGLPHSELAQALESRADACGLALVDVLCVASDGWGSYLDPDCPAGGRPLGAISVGSASADTVDDPVDADQASGADLPTCDDQERAAVAEALTQLERAVARLATGEARGRGRLDPRAVDAAADLDDLPELFDQALDRTDPSPHRIATLLWCLARPALRDVALVCWCRGIDAGDDALDAQIGWERGEEYPSALARTMWGDGPRPDPARVARALALTRRLAAAAPEGFRAGPLALCGWLSWAMGRSTHAERYAIWARDADAEHGLAGILLSFVAAGHLPDWAFRPPGPVRSATSRPRGRFAPGDSFRRPRAR